MAVVQLVEAVHVAVFVVVAAVVVVVAVVVEVPLTVAAVEIPGYLDYSY